jgi:hypothetical protein
MREVALIFLKLGTIAFGGPAAHIAMTEDEFVTCRQWLTREQFLDRLGAANLIPGPSSTEMAIFIGDEKRGWTGLLVRLGKSAVVPERIVSDKHLFLARRNRNRKYLLNVCPFTAVRTKVYRSRSWSRVLTVPHPNT